MAESDNVVNEKNNQDLKSTNPKDAIGSNKLPIHLFPSTAKAYGVMALLDGALKYGRANWREAGVRASIYYDACNRHMDKWFEGQDIDIDSNLPHLAHALACITILIDATENGKLVDDRMYNPNTEQEIYLKLVERFSSMIPHMKVKYQGKNPKHWTKEDNK